MSKNLLLLFNHTLTQDQENDGRISLGISRIVAPPPNVAALWRQIPPDLPAIRDYLKPVKTWVRQSAHPGDFILIQGDFGACLLLVDMALEMGLVAVYSTTAREAVEKILPDGSIQMTHQFRHVRFRRYRQ